MDIKTALLLTKGDVFAAAILAEGGAAKRGSTDERIDKLMRKYKADQLPEAVQNFVDEKTDRRYGNPRYAGQLPDDVAKELFREYLERSEGPSAKRLRPTDAEETGAGASTDAGVPDAIATDSDTGDIVSFGAGLTGSGENEDEDEEVLRMLGESAGSEPDSDAEGVENLEQTSDSDEFANLFGEDLSSEEYEKRVLEEDEKFKEELISDTEEEDDPTFFESEEYEELLRAAKDWIYDNFPVLAQHALEEYQQAWNRGEAPVELSQFVKQVDYTEWVQAQEEYAEWTEYYAEQALLEEFVDFWGTEEAEVSDAQLREFFGLPEDKDLQIYQFERDYAAIDDSKNKYVRTLKTELETELREPKFDKFKEKAKYPSNDWFANYKLFKDFRKKTVRPLSPKTRERIRSAVLHHERPRIKQYEVVFDDNPTEMFLEQFENADEIRKELEDLQEFWKSQQKPELFEYGAGLHVKLFRMNRGAPKELFLFKDIDPNVQKRQNYDLLRYIYNDLEKRKNSPGKEAAIDIYRRRDQHARNLKEAAMEHLNYLTKMGRTEESAIENLDEIFRDAQTVLDLKIDGKDEYFGTLAVRHSEEDLKRFYWTWEQSLQPAPEVDDELKAFIAQMKDEIGLTVLRTSIYVDPPDDYSNFIPEQMSFDFWETNLKDEFEEWIDERIEERKLKFREMGQEPFRSKLSLVGPVKVHTNDSVAFELILSDSKRQLSEPVRRGEQDYWDYEKDVLYVPGQVIARRQGVMRFWAQIFVFGYGFGPRGFVGRRSFKNPRNVTTVVKRIGELKDSKDSFEGWWSRNHEAIERHLPSLPSFLIWVDKMVEELAKAHAKKLT